MLEGGNNGPPIVVGREENRHLSGCVRRENRHLSGCEKRPKPLFLRGKEAKTPSQDHKRSQKPLPRTIKEARTPSQDPRRLALPHVLFLGYALPLPDLCVFLPISPKGLRLKRHTKRHTFDTFSSKCHKSRKLLTFLSPEPPRYPTTGPAPPHCRY